MTQSEALLNKTILLGLVPSRYLTVTQYMYTANHEAVGEQLTVT